MVKCSRCGRIFSTSQGLAIHLGRHVCAQQTIAVCDQCGKTYTVSSKRKHRFSTLSHHFCSLECSYKWSTHPAIAVCDQYGKSYVLNSNHRGRSARQEHHFCSRECFQEWMRREKESDTKILLTCEICDKEFKDFASQVRQGRRFCSTECANKWKSEAMSGANGPGWKGGPKTVVCKNCGKEFLNVLHRGPTLQFCSRACADAWQVGENAPNWKGGPKTMTCLNCGKEFLDVGFTNPRFCSRSCFFQYQGRTKNEELIATFLIEEDIPFEEQYAIPDSNYTVDFFIEPYLIIETDGDYWHDPEKDALRDCWLEGHGYQIMHLDYYDVLNTDDWKVLISDAISVGVL